MKSLVALGLDANVAAIEQQYVAARPELELAAEMLTSAVTEAVAALGSDARRFRITAARVKTLESTVRKCISLKIRPQRLFDRMNDPVACRVICHGSEDIDRLLTHIRAATLHPNVTFKSSADHTIEPLGPGYRAHHVYVTVSLPSSAVGSVTGEIQVKTVTQDAWSELTHDDVYKGEDVPDLISEIFSDLAEQLNIAQRTADRLRIAVRRSEQTHRTIVAPLTLHVDSIVTAVDVERYRALVESLEPYLGASWRDFLLLRLAQRSGTIGADELTRRYTSIVVDVRNADELRCLAFLARCEIPDKGHGGDIDLMIEELARIAAEARDFRSPLAIEIVGEAWFWVGELERHRGRADKAGAAYELSKVRYPERAYHRLALVERIADPSSPSATHLFTALAQATPHRPTLLGMIHRDLAIHYHKTAWQMRGRGEDEQADHAIASAESHLRESLDLMKNTVDRTGFAAAEMVHADIAAYRGHYEAAERLLGDVVAIFAAEGHALFEAQARARRCRVLYATGRRPLEGDIERIEELEQLDRAEREPLQIAKYLAQAYACRGAQALSSGTVGEAAMDIARALLLPQATYATAEAVIDFTASLLRSSGTAALFTALEERLDAERLRSLARALHPRA